MRLLVSLMTVACAAFVLAPAAKAAYPTSFEAVSANPVQSLNGLPIEGFSTDRATRCQRGVRKGTKALAKWLDRRALGDNWGSYRCEMWGKGSASLHAEGRALDWRLNVRKPKERREAVRLISLLLAPDAHGRPAALARRMGIQEIIWDCMYWSSGYPQVPAMGKYSACRKGVDKTTAHRDHIHFGLNKRGAAKQTSWWTRVAPPPEFQEVPAAAPIPPASPPDAGGFQF